MVLSRIDPADADPPDGFVHLPPFRPGDFNDIAGPWFFKDEGGRLVGGFRVMAHHLNPQGVCHGGMLASFCDVYLAMAGIYAADVAQLMAPTISLSLDFLEPTPAGAWVEGRAELLRAGRRTLIVQGLLTVDGRPVVRANGSFSAPQTPLPPEIETKRVALRRLLRGG